MFMKIAMISSFALPTPPPAYGGLEQVVWDLVEELNRMGHEVLLVAADGSKKPEKGELIAIPDPSINTGEVEERALPLYKARLKECDIIHDHSWSKRSYLAKMTNPRLKIISTIHGMNCYGCPPPVPFPNFVGISKSHAMELSSALGIPVYYCYNGINLDKYPFKEEKGERLLFLGRMNRFKGGHIFVELCRNLNIPGDLVGDDKLVEDQGFVEKLKERCDGIVKYWGDTPRDKCAELFQNARALINPLLPPWSEPFGLVNIEAMASGTPVIAMRNGAIPELLLDGITGYLCNSIDELLAKIPLLENIKPANCRARAEYFSRERMAKGYLELYENVLRGKEW